MSISRTRPTPPPLSLPSRQSDKGRRDPALIVDRLGQAIGKDRVTLLDGEGRSIGGESSRVLVEPQTQEEVGEVLQIASAEEWRVVPAGEGTWLEMGNRPVACDLLLSTRRLARLLEYEPADLTATVEAGLSLREFNRVARQHRQWIPLDPFGSPRGTIGAVIATGSAGPLRGGYGTPRDWLIGIRVARIDGRLVRAGGKVVKNVAGYDLTKLYTGSFGTLGVITEATFKLRSIPPAEATISFFADRPEPLIELIERLRSAPLELAAMELLSPPRVADLPLPLESYCLLLRLMHEPDAVEAQISAVGELAAGLNWSRLGEDEAAHLWQWYAESEVDLRGGDFSWRLSLLPADLSTVLGELARQVPELSWRAHVASGIVRLLGGSRLSATKVTGSNTSREAPSLRQWIQARGGELVQLYPAGAEEFETWGPPGPTFPLMRALKKTFDPASLLNPGRYVGRL
jgi:FAD/FMN-containing dehydrogenase